MKGKKKQVRWYIGRLKREEVKKEVERKGMMKGKEMVGET